jgi:hypothetical protein
MYIYIYIPPNVTLPTSTMKCWGIYGTDNSVLTCTLNSTSRIVKITDAVAK